MAHVGGKLATWQKSWRCGKKKCEGGKIFSGAAKKSARARKKRCGDMTKKWVFFTFSKKIGVLCAFPGSSAKKPVLSTSGALFRRSVAGPWQVQKKGPRAKKKAFFSKKRGAKNGSFLKILAFFWIF